MKILYFRKCTAIVINRDKSNNRYSSVHIRRSSPKKGKNAKRGKKKKQPERVMGYLVINDTINQPPLNPSLNHHLLNKRGENTLNSSLVESCDNIMRRGNQRYI
jgi:hypothetical protein